MAKKKSPYRAVALDGTGIELELGVVTQINSTSMLGRIYLEEMKDGKWRLSYTTSAFPDIAKLQAMRIVRSEDEPSTELRHRDGSPVCKDCMALWIRFCPKHTPSKVG